MILLKNDPIMLRQAQHEREHHPRLQEVFRSP